MPTARRSEAAECDLQDVAFQIAVRDRRPLGAERIVDELIAQAERLAQLSTGIKGTGAYIGVSTQVSFTDVISSYPVYAPVPFMPPVRL